MKLSKGIIDEKTVSKAHQELKSIKDSKLVIKLQAIISCSKNPDNIVASVLGKNRVTLWRWIRKFTKEGVTGLKDTQKGHNSAKLDAKQKKIVKEWMTSRKNAKGVDVQWTLNKLSTNIEKEFRVKITKTPLCKMIHDMGFRKNVQRHAWVLADKEK